MTNSPDHEPHAPDPLLPHLSPAGQQAVRAVRVALEDALAQVQSAAQAEAIIESVLAAVRAMPSPNAADLQLREGLTSPPEAQAAITQAAAATDANERLQRTLIEAARQIARSEHETREALEAAVQEATNPEQLGQFNPRTRQSRDWLLQALIKRMGPVQRLDTRLFLLINGLPHSRVSNRLMYNLSVVMNGGGGWVIVLIAAALWDRPHGVLALHRSLAPLWIATMAVEFPIKSYFRRRRPFLDVVQAVAVGRKPLGYSFPSGHAAAAFAGAILLRRYYPQHGAWWYSIATLVGFSRIYLGAHYPGDVISGALVGSLIAEAMHWSISRPEA